MADPTVIDPQYPYTPEEFAGIERTKAEANYPGFDFNVDRFRPAAEGELQPYYGSLFNQLGVLEQGAIDKSNKTYSDVVRGLQEQYNRRGTFFSGEAVRAEDASAGQHLQDLQQIQGEYGGRRAAATVEQSQQIRERAAAMQQQAFTDYQTKRKQEVDQIVTKALSEYIPGYAAKLQEQMADANNPWLEIPLEEGVDFTTTPEAPATATGTPSKYGRYLTPDEAKSGKYKGKTVVIKGSGIRFKSPQDEPGGGYGRWLTPEEAKSGKYKGKVVVIKGKGIRFKTPADQPK